MKKIFAFTISFVVGLICHAQPKTGIDFVATSWEETVQNASKSGKQIFLYAQTKSCQFCRKMEKEVFPDPKVIDFYNANFISYKIDIEDGGTGEAIAQKYGIVAYPTYLFFDRNGKKEHQSSAFKPAKDFIQDGKNASDPNTALFSMLNKYDQGDKSPEFLLNLSNALSFYAVKDSPRDQVIGEYLSTQSTQDLASDQNLKFIFNNYLDFKSPATQYLLKNQDKFIPMFGKPDVYKRARRIVTETASQAGRENNLALLGEVKKVAATNFADTVKMLSMSQIYFYGGKRDWINYAKSTLQYGNVVDPNDWQTMYETGIYLKYFAEDQEALKIGVQIMDKVLKLHKNYEHLCIYSRLQSKVGNNDLALKAAKEAVKVSKAEGEDSGEAEELIAELGAIKK